MVLIGLARLLFPDIEGWMVWGSSKKNTNRLVQGTLSCHLLAGHSYLITNVALIFEETGNLSQASESRTERR